MHVVLCDITELSAEDLDRDFEGAEYGIECVVLISKKTEDDGKFMLKELRDFQIDGKSFIDQSIHKPEPQTSIDNPEKHSRQLADWKLSHLIGPRSLVMTTAMAGDRVENFETLGLKVTFAWGGKPEVFEFEIPRAAIE